MKRWAFLVAGLYGLVAVVLTTPLVLAAFYPAAFDGQSLGEAAANVAAVFDDWGYWLVVAALAACQLALLAVPIRVASLRPVTRGALWPTIVVAGFLAGMLAVAAFLALDEFISKHINGSWISVLGAAIGLATWVAWTIVFRRAFAAAPARDVVSRLCRSLFRGSILELLIAVPTHVVARHREYCCAGFMTFIGLATGIAVMLFAFGPALYYLFAERWRRLHPERGAES